MPNHPPARAAAMLLAAGRGERMRPLTDHTPKPLLEVRGKPLMQWAMEALARDGLQSLVINTAWCGEQIARHFGARFDTTYPATAGDATLPGRFDVSGASVPGRAGFDIHYSHEGRDFGGALETAGGIVRCLPLLEDVFWVLAGDVHVPDFRFDPAARTRLARSDLLAHIWLVPNPPQHPRGDFGLSPDGLALAEAPERHTFSTIGLYKKAFFAAPYCDIPAGNPQGIRAPLAPLLRGAMADAKVSAELYTGPWTDVGTPHRLAQLNDPDPSSARTTTTTTPP